VNLSPNKARSGAISEKRLHFEGLALQYCTCWVTLLVTEVIARTACRSDARKNEEKEPKVKHGDGTGVHAEVATLVEGKDTVGARQLGRWIMAPIATWLLIIWGYCYPVICWTMQAYSSACGV
jgi:hypothetical protein